MLTATVIGSVWATRRVGGLPSGAFLEVEVEAGNGQRGQRLIAFDVLGSGVGERVLVAQGSVAAAWFPGKPPPVDALIIGSIDPAAPKDPKAPEAPKAPKALKAPEASETSAAGQTPKAMSKKKGNQ